jgi:hypothetical protein
MNSSDMQVQLRPKTIRLRIVAYLEEVLSCLGVVPSFQEGLEEGHVEVGP